MRTDELLEQIKRDQKAVLDMEATLRITKARLVRMRRIYHEVCRKAGVCCEYHQTGGHFHAACGDDNYRDDHGD